MMLVMTTSSSATDKVSRGATSSNAPRATGIRGGKIGRRTVPGAARCGEAVRTELRQGRAGVERSAPGTWRRDLKFGDPVVRMPMSGAGNGDLARRDPHP